MQNVFSGGQTFATSVFAGGEQNVGGIRRVSSANLSGGGAASQTVLSGGEQDVFEGATADGTVINDNGIENVSSGGTDLNATINSGTQTILGGSANDAMVASDGAQIINSGGTALSATVFGVQNLATRVKEPIPG